MKALKHKIGPLKVWQWGLLVAAAGAAYLIYRAHQANQQQQAQQAQATSTATTPTPPPGYQQPTPSNATVYGPIDPTTGFPYASGGLGEFQLQEIISLLSKLEGTQHHQRTKQPHKRHHHDPKPKHWSPGGQPFHRDRGHDHRTVTGRRKR